MFVDLHLHSRFARACSPDLNLKNLEKYGRIKGLDLMATGDITHPKWSSELHSLEEKDGILYSKSGFRFILSGEVSNVYRQDDKARRIHNIVLVKNFEILESMNSELEKHANLSSDGRPTFKMSCPQLLETLKGVDRSIEVIPAHIWTPWFSLFGSKNEFNSVEECYADMSKHIFALETGLSSDPSMCSLMSSLDKYSIVSFSDAHSHWPLRIGREATELDCESSFDSVIDSLKNNDILRTIEFFPEEGKYHYDGHRKCRISIHPKKLIGKENSCQKCGKPLTLGVLHRIMELADRDSPKETNDFVKLVPLQEIISKVLGAGVHSKGVWREYERIIDIFGSELEVMLNASADSVLEKVGKRIGDAILSVREGKINIIPGFDGEYGRIEFRR